METNTDYTIEFAGLTGSDEVQMDGNIQAKYGLDENPTLSLSRAIQQLDPVELAELYVKNPYNEDQLLPISVANATINPDTAIEMAGEDADAGDEYEATDGGFVFPGEDGAVTEDVDTTDGDHLTFGVHSAGYAAVPHFDFFFPMAKELMAAETHDVSGQFRVYDNGAKVHGEVLFQDAESQLNLEGDRDPLFVGLSVGNSYDGSSSMYAMGYAMDTFCKNSMRCLTERKARKHIGDPDEVSEWWEEILLQMTVLRDLLGDCINEALTVELDFIEQPFDVEEFYELLGLPGYLARAAATTAKNRSPQEGGTRSTINFWALHSGLTSALTHDFNGSSETGALETYSQTAKDILWNPANILSRVKDEYERQERMADEVDGHALDQHIAMIEQVERTLEDRKGEFEAFEEHMDGLLTTPETGD